MPTYAGMVPLADLFNHLTDGEHLHFTGTVKSSLFFPLLIYRYLST
jgi:hypothetical protein